MATKYLLNPALGKKSLVTLVDGKAVALGEKALNQTFANNETGEEVSREVPLASQEELKAIHDRKEKTAGGLFLVIRRVEQPSSASKK